MSNYHGYWFYSLRNDEVIQAKDLMEEYCILNCPQEYDGPFKTQEDANLYKAAHPNLSKDFNKALADMEAFYCGECNQGCPW